MKEQFLYLETTVRIYIANDETGTRLDGDDYSAYEDVAYDLTRAIREFVHGSKQAAKLKELAPSTEIEVEA